MHLPTHVHINRVSAEVVNCTERKVEHTDTINYFLWVEASQSGLESRIILAEKGRSSYFCHVIACLQRFLQIS